MTKIKKLIFDSSFYGYSLMIALYFILRLFTPTADVGELPNQIAEHLGRYSLVALACFVVSGLITSLISSRKIRTLGDVLFADPKHKAEFATESFWRSFWGPHLAITFVLTVIASAEVTEVSIYELTDPEGFSGALRLYNGLLHANLDILPIAVGQVVSTIFIAFLATILAIPVAFVLAFAAAKNLMTHPLAFAFYIVNRTFLNITRSVEPLIWAVIFTVWVGVGPFAGMLALLIHSVSSLAKQYSEIIEEVSQGPIDGIRSTGAGFLQTVWFGVVPQVVLQFIAYTIYRWDTNVRMATVIGLVGGGGIGTLLIKYQGQAMWSEVGCIIIVIAAVVWLMDTASAYIREALK